MAGRSLWFEKQLKKIAKEHWQDARDLQLAQVRKQFVGLYDDFPSSMISELFQICAEHAASQPKKSVFDCAEKLYTVIDLLEGEYNPEFDFLSKDEWIIFRDLVNEFADDLEDDMIVSVMTAAVDKGLFK